MLKQVEYMQMAMDLAAKGWPQVAPNPMVGCVIVKEGIVVSRGYHQIYGGPHAEVNAINAMPKDLNPADCEIYVTLEPCSHQGKTPPCADLIIKSGFKTVYLATLDPNPLVAGRGAEKLKAAGVAISTGILEEEAKWLNRRFFTFFEKLRPYYVLKWAQTKDGFISRWPIPANRNDNRISGKEAQIFTHHLRAGSSAILVGKNTVLNDNPELTTRLVQGKNPIRLFLDKNLEVPSEYHIYNSAAETIVFNQIKDEQRGHILFKKINFEMNCIEQISEYLYERNIQTVLVEGGTKLLNDFIQQNAFDEILVFENPDLVFRQGIKAPVMDLHGNFEWVDKDKLYRFLG